MVLTSSLPLKRRQDCTNTQVDHTVVFEVLFMIRIVFLVYFFTNKASNPQKQNCLWYMASW